MISSSTIEVDKRLVGGTLALGRAGLHRCAVLCLCLMALAGCASSQSVAVRDELIPQRAQARWDALLAGEYATAYSYASPGYRSSMSAADFEIAFRSRRLQYTSAEYQSHSCEEAVCTVRMRVSYKILRPLQGIPEWSSSTVIKERWITTDGAWWYLPETG